MRLWFPIDDWDDNNSVYRVDSFRERANLVRRFGFEHVWQTEIQGGFICPWAQKNFKNLKNDLESQRIEWLFFAWVDVPERTSPLRGWERGLGDRGTWKEADNWSSFLEVLTHVWLVTYPQSKCRAQMQHVGAFITIWHGCQVPCDEAAPWRGTCSEEVGFRCDGSPTWQLECNLLRDFKPAASRLLTHRNCAITFIVLRYWVLRKFVTQH